MAEERFWFLNKGLSDKSSLELNMNFQQIIVDATYIYLNFSGSICLQNLSSCLAASLFTLLSFLFWHYVDIFLFPLKVH